jgi:rubrerythrin
MKRYVSTEVSPRSAPVTSGTAVKGQFHCTACGYGVTVHTELPPCPMCAGEEWQQSAWTPFTRAVE